MFDGAPEKEGEDDSDHPDDRPPEDFKEGKEKKGQPKVQSIDDHEDLLKEHVVDENGNPVDVPYLQKEIKRRMNEAKHRHADSFGDLPGGLQEHINEILKPLVDWKKELRRFIGQAIRSNKEETWKRPSRRFGPDVKGHRRLKTGRVWFIVDTSASVTSDPNQIGAFADEMAAAAKVAEIVQIDCDCAIHQVKIFSRPIDFKGHGGTSFVPVFAALEAGGLPKGDPRDPSGLLRQPPSAIVYLTDGCGTYPQEDPGIPSMWFFTEESYVGKQPFGKGFYIDVSKKKR